MITVAVFFADCWSWLPDFIHSRAPARQQMVPSYVNTAAMCDASYSWSADVLMNEIPSWMLCHLLLTTSSPKWNQSPLLVSVVYHCILSVMVWLSDNVLALINVVALHWARLVLGWVTVCGYTILLFNQATQSGHPFMTAGDGLGHR